VSAIEHFSAIDKDEKAKKAAAKRSMKDSPAPASAAHEHFKMTSVKA
jgi:hypothetical protein